VGDFSAEMGKIKVLREFFCSVPQKYSQNKQTSHHFFRATKTSEEKNYHLELFRRQKKKRELK
jgi:hypothetical protein